MGNTLLVELFSLSITHVYLNVIPLGGSIRQDVRIHVPPHRIILGIQRTVCIQKSVNML